MNQLDKLEAAGVKPLFQTIKFSDLHPSLGGDIRVRVNPTKEFMQGFQAANEANDNDALVMLTAQLVPVSDVDETPVSEEAWREFLKNMQGNNPAFAIWLVRQILERVSAYFLLATGSKTS